MSRFEGKSALITGAGSGIGRAMALRLAEEGASVMCADIDAQSAQATAARVEDSGARGGAIGLDVTQVGEVEAALQRTVAAFGALDVLMNNAGIGGRHTWNETVEVNLSGVYHGLMLACPIMAQAGGGAIVNTASVAGLRAIARPAGTEAKPKVLGGTSAYVASKHGVVGLTRQFAVAFGQAGVRVNAICPGYIVTPMTAAGREAEGGTEFMTSMHPLGRLGEPEEVASVAAFLASSDASFVTGSALTVDGGYTAQ